MPSEDWLERARAAWTWRGATRPPFAIEPGPGQESVWDYPRPPAIVADAREVVVQYRGVELARSRSTQRLLETSHPPTFYIPRRDWRADQLSPAGGGSFCEWKGACNYFDVAGLARVAWSYETEVIRDHLACYAHELECFVDGERARAQPGGFYGGWITRELVGPFKGESGTSGW